MSELIESSGTGVVGGMKPGDVIIHSQAEYEGHAAKGALPSVKVDVWAMMGENESPEDFERRISAIETLRFEACSQLVLSRIAIIKATT